MSTDNHHTTPSPGAPEPSPDAKDSASPNTRTEGDSNDAQDASGSSSSDRASPDDADASPAVSVDSNGEPPEPVPVLAEQLEVSETDTAPVAPSVAETAWHDDEELEPGDDIGNRIDGPAHHERTTTASAGGPAAKRGRKRRKGKPGASEAGEANGGPPRRGGKGKPGAAQARERPAFRVGEEVFGKVVEVLDDAIIIDLSSKARAIFDRHELSADNTPQIGDHFVANVYGDGSRGGLVVLTHDTKRGDKAKPRVEGAVESGETVEALVTGAIKGGVEVDVDGLRAFVPGSHADLKLGADLGYLVGQRLAFKVMKFAKNGREVVLSRRESLEKDAAQSRKDALAQLVPGQVVDAVVRSVVEWGIFVAITSANNVEGLVHVTEASHERNIKLADAFHTGDKIQVKILRIDEKGKLWLSHKAARGDPWDEVAKKFAVGTRHVGRVARLQPFGVFVALAPGIDGLVRISDLSLRRISDPSEVVSVGDEFEAVVAHLDLERRKIGLHPAPPADENEPRQKVAPHRAVRVAVVAADPAGLVVRILGMTGGAARGFIPAGQTATQRGTDLRREFPVGTILEAKILDLDSRRGECKLSIRALREDSEKAAYNEYRAQVARESKFGTFGDLLAKRNGS